MRRLPSSSKRAVTGISSLLRRFYSSQQGSSYADSVPSNTPKEKKLRKKLLPDERRVMVETYVDRYRSSNSGRFPTVSATQKEVGGGYYTIRAIIQKLEYESKILSINTGNETPSLLQTKLVTKVKEVSSKKITRDEGMVDKEVEAISGCNINSKVVRKSTGTDSDNLAASHPLLKEDAEELLHNSPEKLKPITEQHQQAPKSEVLKPITEPHQQTPESEKFESDYSEKPPAEQIEKRSLKDSSAKLADEEVQKISSMWGNLKSLADGIISAWRKW